MRRILRENAPCACVAAACSVAVGWLGLYGFAWNDYESEAQPAFNALVHGHVGSFLRLAPAYGGSLIERAPFALLPGLWGGGEQAVYRLVAVPCLLAGVALAVWLCARMRAEGGSRLARALAVGICVANPLTLNALELGHPEELLGACLSVAAIVVAARGRPVWAGALLGLAIANKEWAVLAAGPVLLALPTPTPTPARAAREPDRRRRRGTAALCAASACVVAALILGPLVLVSGGGFTASTRAAAAPVGDLFQPWQVWWFFGWHGALVHTAFGEALHGYRIGPRWASVVSHPLIVIVGVGLAAIAWRRRGGATRPLGERGTATRPLRQREAATRPPEARDAMLLFALAMLLRCMLDTWNTGYYMLPFAIALLVWETRAAQRPPLLTLLGVIVPWVALQELAAAGATPDVQAVLFLAWTAPLAAWLTVRLFARERSRRARVHGRGHAPRDSAGAQETTVSALGRLVRTS